VWQTDGDVLVDSDGDNHPDGERLRHKEQRVSHEAEVHQPRGIRRVVDVAETVTKRVVDRPDC